MVVYAKNKNYFLINFKEAQKFAELSGDFNPIHLDSKEGYNSLYSDKIAHGILILFKLIKSKKLKNYFYSDKVEIFCEFLNPTFYNKRIYINSKKTSNEISYNLIQNNVHILFLRIKLSYNLYKSFKLSISKKKNFKFDINKLDKYNLPYIGIELSLILCNISNFVGSIYPGRYSILKSLSIQKNLFPDEIKFNELKIKYAKIDKRFPIINNNIKSKKHDINFVSLIRPSLSNNKYILPNKLLINEFKKIKENVLIIGGSSGIGRDVLDLFLNYSLKKNKIFATYFLNQISNKSSRLFISKINISEDYKKITDLVIKNNIKYIYYFASPKIYFSDINNKDLIKSYKRIYVDIPFKILRSLKNFDLNFFYPSTSYINKNPFSQYSKFKIIAEKKIINYLSKKHKVNFFRLPGIKTKQTLSIVNNNYKDFRYYLQNDKILYKNFFFK